MFIANDIKNKLKKRRPILKTIFPDLNLKIDKINPISIIYDDNFSRFNPTIKDVIVVAMLLPNIIPMLLLKVSILALISVIVSIITAELDCIMAVDKNPTIKLLDVEDVMLSSFCFILLNDRHIRLLLSVSIE